MERRQFVNRAALLSTAGAAAVACGDKGTSSSAAGSAAASTQTFNWRMVMVVPSSFEIWGETMVDFTKQVEAMSQGRLKIRIQDGNVKAGQVFEAVKSGAADLGHSAAYYWQGKMPASVFFTSVPFGMNATGMTAWLSSGGGLELWEKLYAPHGIVPMACGNTGVQMGGWFKKEINSLADLKGLKMRMPGLGGKVIEKFGASPIFLGGADIYPALQTGNIDATEWVGPFHDYKRGFHKIAKYYYAAGWHEPGSVLELIINQRKWKELPADLQAIVRAAAAQADRKMYAWWQAKDSEYLQKIQSEGKVQMRNFPNDVLKGFKSAAKELLVAVGETSPLAKEIYTSYTEFQKTFEHYHRTNEQAYNAAQLLS